MNDTTLNTIEQVEIFLSTAHTVRFAFESPAAGYAWVQATLSRLGYLALGKRAKGIVRRYLLAVTGYSRAQGTRLIRQYRRTGHVQRQGATRPRFKRIYTCACWPRPMSCTTHCQDLLLKRFSSARG